MKKKILIFLQILFTCTHIFAQSPNWVWAHCIGGSDIERSSSIHTDQEGNQYITGQFNGSSVTFGNIILTGSASNNFFVVKYNSEGNVIWAKTATGQCYGMSVKTMNGNVLVSGNYVNSIVIGDTTLTSNGGTDMFLAKYDTAGNFLWARKGGGIYDDLNYDLCLDTNDNCFITGDFLNSITFGGTSVIANGTRDAVVVKYDPAGNLIWVRSGGGAIDDAGTGIRTDANGNCYVSGDFESPTITFGNITLTNAGNREIFIIKYDLSGNLLWAKKCGGSSTDVNKGIVTDMNGNTYISGYFYSPVFTFGNFSATNAGHYDLYLIKLDPAGNVIWFKTEGTAVGEFAGAIHLAEDGSLYVLGNSEGIIPFSGSSVNSGDRVFLAKLDTSGTSQWVLSGGQGDWNAIQGVSSDTLGNVYITGNFGPPTITLGTITLNNSGGFDFFNAKICTDSSNCMMSPIGIKEISAEPILVFPNPSNGTFSIQGRCEGSYLLVNDLGQTVRFFRLDSTDNNTVNIEDLSLGLYFIIGFNKNIMVKQKIVVTR